VSDSTTMTTMERLKSSTRAMHKAAEGHPFQHALGSATLPLAQYRDYLGQLYLVHDALETGLRAASGHAAVSGSVTVEQFQVPFLHADLASLEVDPASVRAHGATQAMVEEIAAAGSREPASLLGYHYVLLGSKHGGKLIARNLEKRLSRSVKGGCSYFDPYGERFMEVWLRFKSGVNDAVFSTGELDALLAAASSMFAGVGAVGSAVLSHVPTT